MLFLLTIFTLIEDCLIARSESEFDVSTKCITFLGLYYLTSSFFILLVI